MDMARRKESSKWHWPLLMAIILLNICLPNLVLSYGSLLIYAVDQGLPIWQGIYTPTIFLVTFCLSQCWCRDAADSWNSTLGHRTLAATGLLLIATGLVLCAFLPLEMHPYIYGITGGLGSSVISAQVETVIFETYDTRMGIVRGIGFFGQAIGQAGAPHLILTLVDNYGYSMSYILLGAVALQLLPVIMFLKVDEFTCRQVSNSRYSDVSKTFEWCSNESLEHSNSFQLHSLSKSWKSPSDEIYDCVFDGENCYPDNYDLSSVTPPPSPEEKRRNVFGVELLPEIPEESDNYEESEDNFTSNESKQRKSVSSGIKRLSILSDNFVDCIDKQSTSEEVKDRIDENLKYSQLHSLENLDAVEDIKRNKLFNSFSFHCQLRYANFKQKLKVPSYKMYRIRKSINYAKHTVIDTFIKPLKRSLSCWRFYPALLMALARLFSIAGALVLFPTVNVRMNAKISLTEINFLMSLHGFTWICFLLVTPWLAYAPKRNFGNIAVFGLGILTASYYIVATARNHDSLSIGCVLAGLGFGAITSSWEIVVKDFIGTNKWQNIQSTLETVSGIFLVALVVGGSFIFNLEDDSSFKQLMIILSGIMLTATILWLAIVVVQKFKHKSRRLVVERNSSFT